MDATRIKQTALGVIGGAAMLLGVFGGMTGAAAGGAVTLSAPEPYDGGGARGSVVQLGFSRTELPAASTGSGPAKHRIGPTSEVG